ncbi:hypothetical protein OIU80_16400 [Flavobacterium sp. LS1R47]|uniref:Uncharacterized protein n=1 Tax=Flavobacterium frigoritolerans TaxID=2987686 RepID=A0A9X3C947_9FLAO|nr:hypothetical protein [Flavobacterium frigoritolerans]MCV9933865.1 hypothetical protein [Flavobacterium frigoritolerans]
MKYFIIKNKEMPWGDYGNTLFRGFLNVMDDNYNDLEIPTIERTGPYVPDIYTVNSVNIIVSEKVKKIFKENAITGIIGYKEIKIKKIVNIDWEKWEKNKDPEFYPKSGEPEDYIFKGKNDITLLQKIPQLWSLNIIEKYSLYKMSNKVTVPLNELELRDKIDVDIFFPVNMLYIIVSENFKNVLELNDIDDLQFIELKYNPN